MTSLCNLCRACCFWYCRPSSSTQVGSSSNDSSYVRVAVENDPETAEKSSLVEDPHANLQSKTVHPSLAHQDLLRQKQIKDFT